MAPQEFFRTLPRPSEEKRESLKHFFSAPEAKSLQVSDNWIGEGFIVRRKFECLVFFDDMEYYESFVGCMNDGLSKIESRVATDRNDRFAPARIYDGARDAWNANVRSEEHTSEL